MNKRSEYSARIAAHFVCALVNGDESGFSQEDSEALREWLEQFDGSVDVCIDEDEDGGQQETHFGRCEVCKLHADVLDVTVVVYRE